MAPSVLRPLSAARVRPQGYDTRYDGCAAQDAARPAFAFHDSYRSFGDSVCGRDIRPAGKARSEFHLAARCAIVVSQHRRGGSGPEILDLEQRAELSPGAVGYNERARSGQRLQA